MWVTNLLAMIVGLLIVAFGLVGMTLPGDLVLIGRDVLTPTGLYVIAILRVCVGVALILAASTSRMPILLRLVGTIAVVAGLTTPLFGVDRSLAVVSWWAGLSPMFTRLASMFAMAFGCFIVYASSPARRTR